MRRQALIFAVLLFTHNVLANPEAEQLKDEALEILKANASRQATSEQYATCIYKLEKAQSILEAVHDSDSALAQEVSSSLFWARKFSDVKVMAALDKLHATNGKPTAANVAVKTDTPTKPVAKPAPASEEPPELSMGLAEAKKAFLSAQAFAQAHANDDYGVALRWFQMASEFPGNDYAIKALEFARAAQSRFVSKALPEEKLPDTPEMNLVKEGDQAASTEKYEESIGFYKQSIKIKETLVGRKHLGRAYFKRAQQLKDTLLPQFEAADEQVRATAKDAYTTVRTLSGSFKRFNPNYPPYVEARKKWAEVCKQGNAAVDLYNEAEAEFKAVLRLSPTGKDLDAAGHIALCWTVRSDASIRAQARQQLNKFLQDYAPTNDLERSLYEYCKTEFERLRK